MTNEGIDLILICRQCNAAVVYKKNQLCTDCTCKNIGDISAAITVAGARQ